MSLKLKIFFHIVRGYIWEHGYAPSSTELTDLMLYASTNSTRKNIAKLCQEGYLFFAKPGLYRSLQLTEKGQQFA